MWPVSNACMKAVKPTALLTGGCLLLFCGCLRTRPDLNAE
jgi:hypothetical protein